ncbi:MAG: hypothetical protein A2958_03195 [Candidatus Levybacteria bacterium RIFCSPLOWO2_01_FULL_38_13]|nr:MAG: hypothetical protein A2629_03610 [Candidatus Levybacteria bacterium RIFCSPHIGHO2_01_FULL_41_15]OGH35324.1 MAG: hypothetical protein A2958_03195 [Candidatus Levybacteria bacterium RIFCSPLOWO2_01_FULL_38_13]
MNERNRRLFERGKSYVLTAKLVYGMYVFITVASTTAIAVSIPSSVLEVLPKWANIALATSGGLNLPSLTVALPKMRRWIKNADKEIKDFKRTHINVPAGSQNN